MRERVSSPLLGQYADAVIVEFDEPVSERHQRAGLQVPLDETPPAQRDTAPGRGRFQNVAVAFEIWRLTADWNMPNSRAACEKLRCRAALSNATSALVGGIR